MHSWKYKYDRYGWKRNRFWRENMRARTHAKTVPLLQALFVVICFIREQRGSRPTQVCHKLSHSKPNEGTSLTPHAIMILARRKSCTQLAANDWYNESIYSRRGSIRMQSRPMEVGFCLYHATCLGVSHLTTWPTSMQGRVRTEVSRDVEQIQDNPIKT